MADASHLPFAAETFGTVVSISTLEHLTGLDQVLAEVARVLRPDGLLVCSVPGPGFGAALFWARLLRSLGCDRAANAYVRLVDRIFRHRNLLSVEDWRGRLGRHGLVLADVRRFNPPAAAAWQDLFYPASLFAAGLRRLTGRWILWPAGRRLPATMLARLTIASLERRESTGTCFFFRGEPRRTRGV
jgi:SAM-dependent methyltransferase